MPFMSERYQETDHLCVPGCRTRWTVGCVTGWRRAVTLAVALAGLLAGGAGPARASVAERYAPLRIMPLGDSITYGLGSAALGSYRADLYRRLVAAGVDADFVGSQQSGPAGVDRDNEGHPGWRIAQIAEQIDGWLATYQPDVVLLHIGTNDMRSDEKAVGAPQRLAALIARIQSDRPDAQVFVARIVGAKDQHYHGVYQRRIDAYNRAVPGVVAAAGPGVHLVDQSTVDSTDDFDTLHPNEFGYARMAARWYRALEPVLNPGGTPWPAGADPDHATRKYLRQWDFTRSAVDARWWYLRQVGSTAVRRWQTERRVTQRYTVTVRGRQVRRTRTVLRWSLT